MKRYPHILRANFIGTTHWLNYPKRFLASRERNQQRDQILLALINETTSNNYADHLKRLVAQHKFLLASPIYKAAIESCHTFINHPNTPQNRDNFLTINAKLQKEINIAISTRRDTMMFVPAAVSMVGIMTSLIALPYLASISMAAFTVSLVALPYIATFAIIGSLIYMAYNRNQANKACKQTDLTEKAIDLVNTITPPQQAKSTQGFFTKPLERDQGWGAGIPLQTLPRHITQAN